MDSMPHTIAGAIIAGGENSRMNGRDKCLLPLGNQRILDIIIDKFLAGVGVLALNTNGDLSRFQPLTIPVISDFDTLSRQGPLAGIIASMRWVADHYPHIDWLLTTASDTPFIPNNYVTLFAEQTAQAEFDVCISHYQGQDHYLNSLWRIAALPILQDAFDAGERSLKRIKPLLKTQILDLSPLSDDPFFNINTQNDYLAAQRRIENTQ